MSPTAPKNLPVWLGVSEQIRRRTVLESRVAITDLPRLREAAAGDAGVLEYRLAFEKDNDGRARVRGRAIGEIELVCQRCLAVYPAAMSLDIDWVLAGSDAEEQRLQKDFDVVLAEDDRLELREVFEDELLLALPIVPRCEREGCTGPADELD